jgi:hypothetical protein
MLFPGGTRPGVWDAPLESGGGLIFLAGLWLTAWVATAVLIPRRHLQIAWGIVGAFAIYKVIIVAMVPMGGVEARIQAADHTLVTSQIASPLRPRGAHGWPLYRSTAVPPLFVNDIRRFDYYGAEKSKRLEVPYRLEMHGYASGTANKILYPSGRWKDDQITTRAVGDGQVFDFKGRATTTGYVSSALFAVSGRSKQNYLTPERLYPSVPEKPPSAAMRKFAHNFAIAFSLMLFLFSGWVSMRVTNPTGSTRRRLLYFLLPAIGGLAAILIPIGRPVALERVILAALLALTGGIALFRYRRHLLLIHHRSWHALLMFAWCILATRFFLDRYPGGFAVLAGGSDSLFHYTFASEIIRGDWLHRADAPFSRQFFMRYILAAVMTLIGEGPVWGMIVNAFAYGVIGLQVASVVRTCGGRLWMLVPPLWLAFAVISPFRMWIPTLFPEVMSIVFLMAGVDQLCKWQASGRAALWRIAAAAGWLGIAIYTRNNYIISVPLVLGLIWYNPEAETADAERRPAGRWAPVALFAAIIAGMVAVVGVRNALLAPAGEPFALLLSQKIRAAALYQGFLPAFIGDGDLVRRYGSLPLDQQFLHALQDRPGLYLRYVLDRIVVLFGGPAMVEPNLVSQYPRVNPLHMVLFGGATLQAALVLIRRRRMSFLQLLAWSLILPQVALVVFMIGYVGEGYRFLLPCYPLLIAMLWCGGCEYRRRGPCY